MRIILQLTCFLIPLIYILAGCTPGSKPSELDRILPQQSTDSERETGYNRSDLTTSPPRNNSTSPPVPTHTKSPFPTDSNPSETPLVPAAFPTDQNIPTQTTSRAQAQIQINNPGSGSRVTSPIQVVSQLNLQGAKLIRIELRGEDGRLLSRILKTPSVFPWSSATISIALLFEIRAPEEPAFLSISAQDLYGRVIAVNTSMVMLVSNGDQKLLEAQSGQIPITIVEPGEGEVISGGTVKVSGTVEPEVPFPLRLELVSSDGKLLGHKWTRDSQNEDRSFNAEVLYTTDFRTPARLIVYSKGDHGDQILYLNSIEIILNPQK